LSTALAEMNLKVGKVIKRALILAKQLEKTFLSLIIIRKEKAVMILRIGYTIYRLITLTVQDKGT
jgi:hypothetical protein